MVYFFCIRPAPRPPNFNKAKFFNEISNTLGKALKSYNIVLAGDLNIDLIGPSEDASNHLSDLIDLIFLNQKILLRNLLALCLTKGLS